MKQRNFDHALLNILVCPMTREKLIYDEEKNLLISKEIEMAYPVRNGIPMLLLEYARTINKDRK